MPRRRMANNLDDASVIHRWLTEFSNNEKIVVQSVALANDADSTNGAYVLAVVIYDEME